MYRPGIEQGMLISMADGGLSIVVIRCILAPWSSSSFLSLGKFAQLSESPPYVSKWKDHSVKSRLVAGVLRTLQRGYFMNSIITSYNPLPYDHHLLTRVVLFA
jgi:hypothetical protein